MQDIKKSLPDILENVVLSDYSTFQIGGLAKYLVKVKTEKALIKSVNIADENNLPFFILGGGSNVLFSDEGYKGLIIKLQNRKIEFKNSTVMAETGLLLSDLIKETAIRGLKGLEWAAGIYGTVGGAIRGNAGSFNGSMSDLVKEVEVYDRKQKEKKYFLNKDCQFDYRDSIFKKNKDLIIIRTKLQFKKASKNLIEKKIQENIERKKEIQPLNYPSIGSIFKNYQVQKKDRSLAKNFPEFKNFISKGFIPAGFLIEEVGLKGKRIGGATFSNKHANFIVNLGKAKSQEVKRLIKIAKERVGSLFGIMLEEEVVIMKN
jgi:UDP-N-acetylmuramate dehydrogenase